jgi:hypothetical protein
VVALGRNFHDTALMKEGKNGGRRNSMRVPCGLRIEVMAKPEPIAAEIMNISQLGFFLRTGGTSAADALRLSTSLNAASLAILIQFRGDSRATRSRIEVAWKSDLGTGLNFLDPPERLKDFIADLQDADSAGPVLGQVDRGWIELGT